MSIEVWTSLHVGICARIKFLTECAEKYPNEIYWATVLKEAEIAKQYLESLKWENGEFVCTQSKSI